MSASSARIALLLASSAISLGLSVWIYRAVSAARATDTVLVVDNTADVVDLLSRRAAVDGETRPSSDGDLPPLVREPLDEKVAKLLFPFVGRGRFDPYLYYTHEPNLDVVVPFPEHPDGEYRIRTNSAGMREEEEVRTDRPGLRVLVAGDSHTDGVCSNEENFTSLLEARLRSGGRDAEVLNAATFGYSMYQYLALLEHFIDLEPDVFVVAVYGGNDFYSMLTLQRYFHRRGPPNVTKPNLYQRIREVAPGEERGVVAQELGQVRYFLDNPGDVGIAVATACRISLEIDRIGEENGARVLFLYLPPPYRGQPHLGRDDLARYLEWTGLKEDDLLVSDEIADRWLAFLNERRIACVDLRPVFRNTAEPLYWRADHHLNVAGHRVVADVLYDAIAAGPGAPR